LWLRRLDWASDDVAFVNETDDVVRLKDFALALGLLPVRGFANRPGAGSGFKPLLGDNGLALRRPNESELL